MTDEQGRRRPQGTRAYIGSFTSDGGRGVTTAAVDPRTGALTPLHHTGGIVPDPSYLTVGGGILYTVSETVNGAAAAFSLTDPDRPVLLGEPTPVAGASPTHLAIADGRLFTANYASGSVSTLAIRADGRLGGSAAVRRHEGHGPVTDRQEGPHAHAVVPDPSLRWLLATDLGADEVRVYALDGAGDDGAGDREGGAMGAPDGAGDRDGAGHLGYAGPEEAPEWATARGPRLHRRVRMRAGTGPRHLVFHPNGQRAYVINELKSVVTTLRWDPERGGLEWLGETSTLPQDERAVENYPSALTLSADGRHAWAANRGHDSIAVLALDGTGDDVTLAGTVPCSGHWPRDLALHPSGRLLYVAGERSGDITWFTLDGATGFPRREGAMPAPAASCVVFA